MRYRSSRHRRGQATGNRHRRALHNAPPSLDSPQSLPPPPTIPPPSVEANYKPIVALVFAIVLAVVGIWSSKKRPWKGGKDRMAVAKAFTIFSLPFVLAEATTGIVSLATGHLLIPPIVGIGTAVDLIILVVGLAAMYPGFYRSEARPAEEPQYSE